MVEQTETGREQAGAARDRVSLYRRLRGRTSEKGTLRRVWVEQLEAGWVSLPQAQEVSVGLSSWVTVGFLMACWL